ncbi:MAG: GyrI-like domain-containing protein [Flavobacteriaceae bacterium]
MNLAPQFLHLQEKQLIGISMEMSVAGNRTTELWQTFMPKLKEINHRLNEEFYSLQIYDKEYFHSFDPDRAFTKWAAVEVSKKEKVPTGLQSLLLSSGKYAVFLYRGLAANPGVFEYIFSEWLPKSGFKLDNRPHFEILGANYRANDPASEEEIWIPIKG